MKILVVSDSHGSISKLKEIIEIHADMLFFLGDGEGDFDNLIIPDKLYYAAVKGNCDLISNNSVDKFVKCGDKEIMLTHGHAYSVKQGVNKLYAKAVTSAADIVCYGHTHIQSVEKIGDVYLVNPGSLLNGDYAVIDITEGEIDIELKRLE